MLLLLHTVVKVKPLVIDASGYLISKWNGTSVHRRGEKTSRVKSTTKEMCIRFKLRLILFRGLFTPQGSFSTNTTKVSTRKRRVPSCEK